MPLTTEWQWKAFTSSEMLGSPFSPILPTYQRQQSISFQNSPPTIPLHGNSLFDFMAQLTSIFTSFTFEFNVFFVWFRIIAWQLFHRYYTKKLLIWAVSFDFLSSWSFQKLSQKWMCKPWLRLRWRNQWNRTDNRLFCSMCLLYPNTFLEPWHPVASFKSSWKHDILNLDGFLPLIGYWKLVFL